MIAAPKLELAEPLADADGPFHTFDDAPLGEPFTAEERAAFDEAVEDIRAGRAHTRWSRPAPLASLAVVTR